MYLYCGDRRRNILTYMRTNVFRNFFEVGQDPLRIRNYKSNKTPKVLKGVGGFIPRKYGETFLDAP